MNENMDDGGASKRPFGPHGEGCTCDWEETPGMDDPGIEYAVPSDPYAMLSPEERLYTQHLEISLGAMSSKFVEHFLNGMDTAAASGVALTRNQVIIFLSTLMTGYAESCEFAKQAEQQFRQMAVEGRRARLAAREEADPAKHADKLGNVADIFTVPPQSDGNDSD